jgi:hypothetical protein
MPVILTNRVATIEIKLSLTGHDSAKKHTTMKSEILQQLKDMITIMLDDCDKYTHPHVCNMANNPNTREELESMIIEISKQSGLSVGQAIEQIERAYNPNKIED